MPHTEMITMSLYDSVRLNDSKEIDMFISPVGINGKSLADTNMVLSGHLPSTQQFLIKEVIFISDFLTTFKLVIGCAGSYGDYKFVGVKYIILEPVLIRTKQFFMWRVQGDESAVFPQKVTIVMLGLLTRPFC